jgi:hypothetical protein
MEKITSDLSVLRNVLAQVTTGRDPPRADTERAIEAALSLVEAHLRNQFRTGNALEKIAAHLASPPVVV